MRLLVLSLVLACLFGVTTARADTAAQPAMWQPIGNLQTLDGWQNLKTGAVAGIADWPMPSEAWFRYPQGPKGWTRPGFRTEHDGTADWRSFYGLQLDVELPADRAFEGTVTLLTPPPHANQAVINQVVIAQTQARVRLARAGWHRVTLPWGAFDFAQSQPAFLKFIQEVHLAGRFVDGQPGKVRLKNIRLTRAAGVWLDCSIRGKPAKAGGDAQYVVTVGNCTDQAQAIALSVEKYGWEAMNATLDTAELTSPPGAAGQCTVTVHVPEKIPPGGQETTVLKAVGNGDGATATRMEFVTVRELPRPNILHTAAGWQAIRETVKNNAWAQAAQDGIVKRAEEWQVPQMARPPNNIAEGHVYLFKSDQAYKVYLAGMAWQLTGEKKYAEKVAIFLRRLADENSGYPATLAACNQGIVQEGQVFQPIAWAYDLIGDAGVLSDADIQSIDRTLRLHMETMEAELTKGNVSNYQVAQCAGCAYCALAMQDLASLHRYIWGPCGYADFLSKGVMDDGWWWEGATGYNLWVSSELTQVALACEPWGMNLKELHVPAAFSPRTILEPWATGPQLFGMSFENWGPNRRNDRTLKSMWDAVGVMADDRGVCFGFNDGHEDSAGFEDTPGQDRFEVAYYAFGDPAYAAIIKNCGPRHLLYGAVELPAVTPRPFAASGTAENLGITVLRSQTADRPQRQQIEAALKFGSHGGYHGHFDRASMVALMRYGRSFYNPEMIWYGYGNYMYKFYVQTSMSHNMVVVDQKMQEPVESVQRLFYSGKMMQAAAVETNARWSDPPFGGMRYDWFNGDFADKMWADGQTIPIPPDAMYGKTGPYGEHVLQRRLMVVTDDYVVLADALRGEAEHTFDCLFQIKGFQGLEAAKKKLLRHDGQMTTDAHSAAQFITDCDWYDVTAPAVSHFETKWGAGADNQGTRTLFSEDGVLKMDVHSLWPATQEVMIGTAPETHNEQQRVTYAVIGDGKTLAAGRTATWILGAADVDVPVAGLKELALQVTSDGGGGAVLSPEGMAAARRKALFWAHARSVADDGTESPLAAFTGDNVDKPAAAGKDYYGGPIKIAGVECDDAIPTQPVDLAHAAVIHLPLPHGAVRFKATLGGDFPFGDESQRRKTYAIRSRGKTARFLTLIEPYEDKPAVQVAHASDADHLQVTLTDGRVQEVTIKGLEGDGADASVTISEKKDGKEMRQETTTTASRKE
jgi:hypothetical protein